MRPRQGVTTKGVDFFLDEGARMKARIEEFEQVKTAAEKVEEQRKFIQRLAEHQRKWSDDSYRGELYREEGGAKGWTFDELRKTCHAWKSISPPGCRSPPTRRCSSLMRC